VFDQCARARYDDCIRGPHPNLQLGFIHDSLEAIYTVPTDREKEITMEVGALGVPFVCLSFKLFKLFGGN
jgi:hypothetical protein